MCTRSKKALFAVIAVVALVLSTGWATASLPQDGQYGQNELVGTWSVTVQLNNCSGTSVGGPFQSLLTFANGGTMIEDTTNPSFAIGQRGTGHGVWAFQGSHTFSAKSISFINFTTLPPPPPGFTKGTQTITQTIVFDNGPDAWTANAAVEFADTTGAVYRQGCATASGQRFQ